MSSSIEGNISSGCCAEDAVAQVCDMFIGVFSMADDELTKQRASDVEDIKNGLITMLLGKEEVDIASAPSGTVLVAKDLTPSMTSCIVKENIVGIVTEVGGKTSHSAILARAMEIPAVLSVHNVMETFENGQEIIVDGSHGEVIENPSDGEIAIYREKTIEYKKEKKELKKFIGKETVTADGVKVELCCNIGKPDDADAVLSKDGEGVGLFRTEFLYMDSSSIPTEEEQFFAYKTVAERMAGKKVIIRTLDIGADKQGADGQIKIIQHIESLFCPEVAAFGRRLNAAARCGGHRSLRNSKKCGAYKKQRGNYPRQSTAIIHLGYTTPFVYRINN